MGVFNSINSDINALSIINFKCYPNPTTGILIIEIPENLTITRIKLIDISGKVIYENEYNTNVKIELNLASYKKGQYLLQIEDKNGNLCTEKVIRQ